MVLIMFRGKVLVVEIKDNFHDVRIDVRDDLIFYNITDCDDAEMALRAALEYKYGDCDYTYTCCSEDGVYYKYDFEVIDDVE